MDYRIKAHSECEAADPDIINKEALMDYHIKAHSECKAADPNTTNTLQITFRPGATVSTGIRWEEVSFRHLHPDLITRSKDFDKVTLLNRITNQKKVLKENGKSVEPYYVD